MSNPIDPEQGPISDPKAVECNRKWNLVEFGATGLAVLAGGVLTFAALMVPARAMGGTRSARITWQQQQAQVQSDSAAVEGETTKEQGEIGTSKERL
jgi:hypothetical protein